MPYANPQPLFVDLVHPGAGRFAVDQTWGLARPGTPLTGMELVWGHDQFPDDLSGRCLLLRLGLTCSIIEFSDEKAGIRFVITLEVTGPHGQATQREAQIVRGDAWASPGKGGGFGLTQFYGPIEPLRPGQLMTLRAYAAALAGTAVIAPGDLGSNEFRAEAFRVG
jgi:hypothetical protein